LTSPRLKKDSEAKHEAKKNQKAKPEATKEIITIGLK
jgi:hypothetical protein